MWKSLIWQANFYLYNEYNYSTKRLRKNIAERRREKCAAVKVLSDGVDRGFEGKATCNSFKHRWQGGEKSKRVTWRSVKRKTELLCRILLHSASSEPSEQSRWPSHIHASATHSPFPEWHVNWSAVQFFIPTRWTIDWTPIFIRDKMPAAPEIPLLLIPLLPPVHNAIRRDQFSFRSRAVSRELSRELHPPGSIALRKNEKEKEKRKNSSFRKNVTTHSSFLLLSLSSRHSWMKFTRVTRISSDLNFTRSGWLHTRFEYSHESFSARRFSLVKGLHHER